MLDVKLAGIVYDDRKLREVEKTNNGTQITEVIGIQQKIHLSNCVIEEWKIQEDLEGICSIHFKFHYATKRHNMMNNYSHYEVRRNADEKPILIRVLE